MHWLLAGQAGRAARRGLTEAAGWLVVLRGTVQFDSRQHEAAWTSVRTAQQLARDIGHHELEALTFETMAWMAATDNRQHDARELATAGISVAPAGGYGLVAATLQRARINGAIGDHASTMLDLRSVNVPSPPPASRPSPTTTTPWTRPRAARFFASGAWTQLRRPAETIENAAEVVRASEDPRTRNFWPMRVANARVEWAMALTDLGQEDEAGALVRLALDPLWLRPDTERRMGALLARMRETRGCASSSPTSCMSPKRSLRCEAGRQKFCPKLADRWVGASQPRSVQDVFKASIHPRAPQAFIYAMLSHVSIY